MFALIDFVSLFDLHYVKYIFFFGMIGVICLFLLFIISSYAILKLMKLNIDNNNILFYQYNKKSKQLLERYGDYKLTKLYLVRQPLTKIVTFVLNIMTFYNYDKLIQESQDNFPYHTLLIFEIKLDNGMSKLLTLEKNNSVSLCDNFLMNSSQDIVELKLTKNKYTLNNILTTTQQRLGNEKFFNWHLYKNNCQEFTKEILKTIGKYTNKNKQFIFRDKLFKIIIPSEFTLHVCNCLCIIYNISEKFISNALNI